MWVVVAMEEEEAAMTGTPHHLPSITPRMLHRETIPLYGRSIKGVDRGGMNVTERSDGCDEGGRGERRR